MIMLPPVIRGGTNDTVACILPGAAATLVGAPGVVRGVTNTGVANVDPAKLETPTVQLYCTPLTSDVTVSGEPPPDAKRVVWPLAAQFAP